MMITGLLIILLMVLIGGTPVRSVEVNQTKPIAKRQIQACCQTASLSHRCTICCPAGKVAHCFKSGWGYGSEPVPVCECRSS